MTRIVIGIAVIALIAGLLALQIRLIYNLLCKVKRIKSFKEKSKAKKISLIVIIALVFIVIFEIDFMNTLIVLVHFDVFLGVAKLISKGVFKIKGKEIKMRWQVLAAVLAVVIYLGIGFYNAVHVSETDYSLSTSKDIKGNLRVVQISDSHIGATFDGEGFGKELERIQKTNPDVVVLTGDFVDDDTSKEDMIQSCKELGKLKSTYGTYLVWGNHDKGYMEYRDFVLYEVKDELEKNGIVVLEDESVLVDDRFYIVGRNDKSYKSRKSAQDMTEGLDKSKYIIMLDHQPNDFEAEEKSGADLVLSGHTHGGQLIPIGLTGELSGVNDKTYGLEKRGNTTFIVNSGISDWAVKFKTGTFSEFGVIDIGNEQIKGE